MAKEDKKEDKKTVSWEEERKKQADFLQAIQRGMSDKEACGYSEVTKETVNKWKQDPDFVRRYDWNYSYMAGRAIKNLTQMIEKGNTNVSQRWLERTEKHRFSARIEATGKEGEAITPIIFLPQPWQKEG